MDITPMAPRPKPTPDWNGVVVAKLHQGMGLMAITSTGGVGRDEGYDSRANALRAARMLSRGAGHDAVAVVGYEGRWYVQGLRAEADLVGSWRAPLRFEHAFPAPVGPMRIDAGTRAFPHLAGLEAIVDGSRNLGLHPTGRISVTPRG
jgi:hypothetical protein